MKINRNYIPYVNLKKQWAEEKKYLSPIILKVLSSGNFIGGEDISRFEKSLCKYIGCKYAVALNSGTDALTLGLKLIGISKGDEVITPSNSFISSTSSIVHLGARPTFVDVLPDQNIDPDKIESLITNRTKAIMPVHLTGRVCEMNKILKIAKKHSLFVIEDAAQSIGSKYNNRMAGTFGKVGCFSTHPLKNLNACGDGGFITTNDYNIFEKASSLRNNGLIDRNNIETFGYLSRMDNIQAAILNYRLKKLNKVIYKRRNNALQYLQNIKNSKIDMVLEKKYQSNTYHTFVIQTEQRNELKSYLEKNNVETAIHYPFPIHMQAIASKYVKNKKNLQITEDQSKKILSLPIHQYLTKKEINIIISLINNF